MRIGIISDTHIPYAAKKIPRKALDLFAGVDAIIHAGDFQDMSVIADLEAIAPFYGVAGNMDDHTIKKLVPEKRIISLGGFSIGVMHGSGAPSGLEDRIEACFKGEKLDALIYGHTHTPANIIKHNVLFFNPGSPTDSRFAEYNSIGILTLGATIAGEIVRL